MQQQDINTMLARIIQSVADYKKLDAELRNTELNDLAIEVLDAVKMIRRRPRCVLTYLGTIGGNHPEIVVKGLATVLVLAIEAAAHARACADEEATEELEKGWHAADPETTTAIREALAKRKPLAPVQTNIGISQVRPLMERINTTLLDTQCVDAEDGPMSLTGNLLHGYLIDLRGYLQSDDRRNAFRYLQEMRNASYVPAADWARDTCDAFEIS